MERVRTIDSVSWSDGEKLQSAKKMALTLDEMAAVPTVRGRDRWKKLSISIAVCNAQGPPTRPRCPAVSNITTRVTRLHYLQANTIDFCS